MEYESPEAVEVGGAAAQIEGQQMKRYVVIENLTDLFQTRRTAAVPRTSRTQLPIAMFILCLRSSRQRTYCSVFLGSGSSSLLSQKQNQSTLPS